MSLIVMVVAYLIVGIFVIGLPVTFFLITFMPGLMRTTGETIGSHPAQSPPQGHAPQPVSARSVSVARVVRKRKLRSGRNFMNTP